MDMERMKLDYDSLRDAYGSMNRSYVQECAHNQLLKNEIDKLNNDIWLANSRLKKSVSEAERYYSYVVMYCNGEMTLERLKDKMKNDKGPTKFLVIK